MDQFVGELCHQTAQTACSEFGGHCRPVRDGRFAADYATRTPTQQSWPGGTARACRRL
ncbi:hypothetical protein MBELCI_3180 [Limimaricola cinnabarinus LL-001]|uniref:Uncharacterized protein n=1 Tax=Limimaricola cinnabarinus LL-001 TaxID=1337093 RepID=U3AQW2_9RHOB|nr:hypothetical protein MBELCI_3180 [Limimaricola cinnabarinus LL-001]